MKPLHHPIDSRTYFKGANADTEKEFLGRQAPGFYVDAQNMRPEPVDGEHGALTKVQGELLLVAPPNIPGSTGYRCLGTFVVNGYSVAYWAHPEGDIYPPIMTIDGIVKMRSFAIPWDYRHPFQYARAEDCDEALLMGVDDFSIPMLFSIRDINEAYDAGLETYFSAFDPSIYYINPTAPVERPQFLGLEDVGAGGGLSPGQYAYALRFVDDQGNRTNIGPYTPLIAVPINLGAVNGYIPEPGMPGASLQGGALADVGQPTKYGAVLRWRINNTGNYARIELLRMEFNVGDGINTAPEVWLAHAIDIPFGIQPWVQFTDVGEHLELIADDEVNTQSLYILKAKGVRHIDNRFVLANVEVAPKDVSIDFREVGGQKMFAITKSIGKVGHHDPVNHAYYKTEIRGERRRFAIQLFDGMGGKPFVVPLPDEFQFPNRRDLKDGDSLLYSDASCWAANVDHVVTPTFEAFDMEDASQKSRVADFVNIMVNGGRNENEVDDFAPYPDPPFSDGTYVDTNFGTIKTIDTRPVRPTRPTDNQFGHDYRMNLFVRDEYDPNAQTIGYNPRGFEPTFHSLGACIYGLLNLFPWVSGFSIVESDAAGRVICQGLLSYKLGSVTTGGPPAGKSQFSGVLHFPDMNTGIVPENTINDFLTNPQNFTLQFQSPQGIFTEVLGGVSLQSNTDQHGNSAITDMMSYARVAWDLGQINPLYSAHGIQPTIPGTPNGNYTGYDAWRNTIPSNSLFHGGSNNGNSLVPISTVTPILTPANSSHFEVTLGGQLYFGGVPNSRQFSAQDTKDFHEPFYVVNLVQDGAHVDAALIDGWKPTGHYQRMRSIIGEANGTQQSFTLVDERIDDVLTPPGFPLQERYLWVDNRAWFCITNINFTVSTIINAINGNGFWLSPDGVEIYGVYTVDLNTMNDVTLGYYGIYPPVGARVEIRYNSNAPIKFFGGDATISQALSMPINQVCKIGTATVDTYNANPNLSTPASIQSFQDGDPIFTNACPLPFPTYRYNPRYYVPFGVINAAGGNGNSAINQTLDAKPYSIRQWGILFDCECRTPLHISAFIFNDLYNQGFPKIHYVPRPAISVISDTLANNGVFDGYEPTFGADEKNRWAVGGIRWATPSNYDYAALMKKSSFSRPAFGFEEKTDLCNVIVWTPRVTSQVQNNPGYRTFPATNIRWIDGDAGQINKLYSAVADGFNLYALTSSGVCELLVNRSILTGGGGEALSSTRQDEFLTDGGERWISKAIGLPGETWQLAAEGQSGNPKRDTLFFMDRNSAYALVTGSIVDIAKGRYRTKVRPLIASALDADDCIMGSVYDPTRDEWFFTVRPQETPDSGIPFDISSTTLVYSASELINNWIGSFAYSFDKYLAKAREVYGYRDLQTWKLDDGQFINGQLVDGWAQQACSPEGLVRKEFDMIKITSLTKPTYVEFFDEDGVFVCRMDAAFATSLGDPAGSYLKMKDGWTNFIPRRTANRLRLQGRVMQYRVGHSENDEFRLIEAGIMVKRIK